jgi:myo-inositol-1(or 4)-monophosphatase
MSEAAILEVVKKNFDDHLILGEEGGIIGDTSSDYLWCIDPLGLSLFILVFLGNNS